MKSIKNLAAAGLVVFGFAACKSNSNSKSAIEGTYVKAYQQEFAKGYDTLIITAYNKEANSYNIQRRTGYNRIEEGKLLPRKLEQEAWMATYNEDKLVLQQTEFGRQVYVNTKAHTLSFGGTYQKIK